MEIGCLIKNHRAIGHIKQLMEIMAADLIDSSGKAPFRTMYRELKENGIEIDVESAAVLYQAQFDTTQNFYTSDSELEEISGEVFAKTLSDIVKLENKVIDSKTGERSPGRNTADKVGRLFTNSLIEVNKITSPMRKMQDALEKAVLANVKKKKPQRESKNFSDNLQALLEEADFAIQMNTMKDVVSEWRAEMDKYREGITDTVEQEQWDRYVEEAIGAVYNVFLSNRQAREIVDQALFKQGFGKTNEDGREVKDWRKLAGGIKSIEMLKDNVMRALESEVGPDNALRISESLAKQYKELRARQIAHNTKELTKRNKFKAHETKTELDRLLALYDYGLFDPSFKDQFKRLTAKTIGLPIEGVAAMGELQSILADFSEIYRLHGDVDTVSQEIERRISRLVASYQGKQSLLLKAMQFLDTWVDSGNKAILYSLRNALLQNQISNLISLLNDKIGTPFSGKALVDDHNINEVANAFFRLASTGSPSYGAVSNQFSSRTDLASKWLSSDPVQRNKALQVVISGAMGNWALDGSDSFFKYKLTQRNLINNLRRIIVDNRHPKDKAERRQFEKEANEKISEALYGESFEKAKDKAREIIRLSNGKLRDSEDNVTRLADDIVKSNIVQNGLMTAQQYSSAFDAAYQSAGEAIGHEGPHNVIGMITRGVHAAITEGYTNALKKGEMNKAAMWLFIDIMVNKIMLKYVGGASNWLVIGLKRSGLGLLTSLVSKGSRKVDLSKVTEQDLKEELVRRDRFHRDIIEGLMGGLATTIVFLLTRMGGDDDDSTFDKWLAKNKWARTYAYAVGPLAVNAYLYAKDAKLKQFIGRTFMLDDQYAFMSQLYEGVISGEGYKGRELSDAERMGILGQVMGREFLQVPFGIWRVVRDFKDVYKGAVLGQEKEWQEDPTSFLEGLLWGDALYTFGGVDYLKDMGVIPVEDVSAIKGVGIKSEEALYALPGFKDMSRRERLDFLYDELRKQLLEEYSQDKDLREEVDNHPDFDKLFPELVHASVNDRKRMLGELRRQLGKHQLKKPKLDENDQPIKNKVVNIFQKDDLIPAILDIESK